MDQGEWYIEIFWNEEALMIKVIVCDHGCEGSRLDVSATPTKRDHKMTLTPSGTLSMKDPTWRMGPKQGRF